MFRNYIIDLCESTGRLLPGGLQPRPSQCGVVTRCGNNLYSLRPQTAADPISRGGWSFTWARFIKSLAGALVICWPAVTSLAKDNDMIYIPAGEFIMGTSDAEIKELAEKYSVHPSLFATERPKRKVNVPAFYIDRYPVTNAEYKKFVDATNHHPPRGWVGGKYPEGQDDYPVTMVGWKDADAYAKWAGKRLPTEEEWEKAARGTDGRLYPWGNEWVEDACWIDDGKAPQTRPRTTPVGCFPRGASPYGVMDMAGNVAEWTSTPARPPTPDRGWAWYVVKGAGNAHMMRYNFRCAARNFSAHTSRAHPWLGFRCAKDAEGPPPSTTPSHEQKAKPIPQIPPCKGPDASAYGKRPIGIIAEHGASPRFSVPFFPEATFSLYCPEQSGAAGVPLAWAAGRPPIKWKVNEEGTVAEYECTFEGRAVQRVPLKSGMDYVDFTISIKNLTDKMFTGVGTNSCFNNYHAPYFDDPEWLRTMVWTDDGPARMIDMDIGKSGGEIMHGGWAVARPDQKAPKGGNLVRYPFIFLLSRDGDWVIAQAYAEGRTVASNSHYSCLHSRPVWPDIPPGEERSVTGKLYFLRGGPDDLLKRWKEDFGK